MSSNPEPPVACRRPLSPPNDGDAFPQPVGACSSMAAREVSIPPAASTAPRLFCSRRGRSKLLATACVLCLGGGLIALAELRTSTGAASGRTLHGEGNLHGSRGPRPEGKTIRLATFNIQGGKGRDGRRDLDRTAETLKGFDIAGLNEVRGGSPWDPRDQAQLLGEKLGLAYLFAPGETRWWRGAYGNAVLSSLPARLWMRFPLPRARESSHRSVLWVEFEHRGRTIPVLITHTTPQPEEAQRSLVFEMFLSLDEPAILMGDFNARGDHPEILRLLATAGVRGTAGESATGRKNGSLDWIFTRGLRWVESGVRDEGASDHDCHWVELDLD